MLPDSSHEGHEAAERRQGQRALREQPVRQQEPVHMSGLESRPMLFASPSVANEVVAVHGILLVAQHALIIKQPADCRATKSAAWSNQGAAHSQHLTSDRSHNCPAKSAPMTEASASSASRDVAISCSRASVSFSMAAGLGTLANSAPATAGAGVTMVYVVSCCPDNSMACLAWRH